MKNIYYFRVIANIGGIETFFRNLAEEYKDWDITFYYSIADPEQLKVLKKYCRCIKFDPANFKDGKKVQCDRAFFNFNLDMLSYVDAKETILVVHGNYKLMGIDPPKSTKIDRVVAVSKDSAKAYEELTGIKCDVCYNPLIYKKPAKLLKLICACRLADPIKGGKRLQTFVTELDKYCKQNNLDYMLTLFTNGGEIQSDNVVMMKTKVNILPYMQDADYLLQFSDAEGYCYSIVEMLYLCKKPVICTPCPVYKELDIDDKVSITLNFDMSNLNEVFDKMFNTSWDINYEPPKDSWDKLLVSGKTTYHPVFVKVKTLIEFKDLEENRIRKIDDEFEVLKERADYLISRQLVKEIK